MKATGVIIGVIVIAIISTIVFVSQKEESPSTPSTNTVGNVSESVSENNSNTSNNTENQNTVENTNTTSGSVNSGQTSGANTAPSVKTYSMVEVSTHNSQANCWSVIDGGVYNLTSWVGKHPGGAPAIGKLCGKDGSATFHGQHGNAKTQADILVTFKIGALVN